MIKYLITALVVLFHTTILFSQLKTIKSNQLLNLTDISIQDSSDGKISIKNLQGNIVLEINDETTGGSVSFPPLSVIGNHTNKLYNLGNKLYWNDKPIGQSGVGNGWYVNNGNLLLSDSNYLIGIGTDTPEQKLHIKNGKMIIEGNNNWFPGLTITNEIGRSVLNLRGTTSSTNFSSVQISLEDITNGKNWNLLNTNTNTFTLTHNLNGSNYSSPFKIIFGAPTNSITINSVGNVGIGTWSNEHKLAVAGSIIAEEIIVKLQTNWPDYVFNNKYELLDINELEEYININHHLTNIPSASEVKQSGVNVAEIQIKLLQKIEELTLYLIEQDKHIKKLTHQIQEIKNR